MSDIRDRLDNWVQNVDNRGFIDYYTGVLIDMENQTYMSKKKLKKYQKDQLKVLDRLYELYRDADDFDD